MKQKIIKVREKLTTILDEIIIKLGNLNEEAIYEILDSREIDLFDNNWVGAYEALKQQLETLNENEKKELDEFLEEIRKEAFIKTMKASKSSDLAAYVSDDFEMIGKALIIEFTNSFIDSLLNIYDSGIVPDNISIAMYELENIINE
jgi:wyosine [tRNA(Phe)-imidazoG37] synthetase (radical SAM superfamily)